MEPTGALRPRFAVEFRYSADPTAVDALISRRLVLWRQLLC